MLAPASIGRSFEQLHSKIERIKGIFVKDSISKYMHMYETDPSADATLRPIQSGRPDSPFKSESNILTASAILCLFLY
jgi:hypothetical protein